MADLHDRLRAHAGSLDEAFVPLDPAALRSRAVGRPADKPDSATVADLESVGTATDRGHRALVVAALTVVVLVAALVAITVGRQSTVSTVNEPERSSLGWTEQPSLPIDPNSYSTDVEPIWTGRELVLVGQSTGATSNDSKGPNALGVIPAFTPATRTWREIDPPPVAISAGQLAATWTGSRVIVVGTPVDAQGSTTAVIGASLDPASGRWTPIAAAPAGRAIAAATVWTGDRLLMWQFATGVTSYDPVTDRWEIQTDEHVGTGAMAPKADGDPPRINDAGAAAVWTGTEMVVVDRSGTEVGAYDPATRRWRVAPPNPKFSLGRPHWTGSAVVVGDGGDASLWQPQSESWDTRSSPLGWTGEPGSAAVTVGDRLYSWASHLGTGTGTGSGASPADHTVTLDLATGVWADLGPAPDGMPPLRDALVGDDIVFTWGAGYGQLRLATIATSALTRSAGPAPPVPTGTDLRLPAGVNSDELQRGTMAASMADPTKLFLPYRNDDSDASVVSATAARTSAARALVDQGIVTTDTPFDALVTSKPQLGHLVLGPAGASTSDTLAWKVVFRDIPTGSGKTDLVVLLDAQSGAPLFIEAVPPAGG